MASVDMARAENKPTITIFLHKSSRSQDLIFDLEYDMDAIPGLESDETKDTDARDATLSEQGFWSKVEEASTAVTDSMQQIIRLQQARCVYHKDKAVLQDSAGKKATLWN
jgi:hypothetical protein